MSKKLTAAQINQIEALIAAGATATRACEEVGVERQTFYNYRNSVRRRAATRIAKAAERRKKAKADPTEPPSNTGLETERQLLLAENRRLREICIELLLK